MCNVVFASPKSTFCSSRSYIPHCRDIPQIYLECSRNVVNFTAITVQIQNVLAQYIRTVQLTLLVHVQMYLPSVRDTILRPFADHFNPKVPFETLHDVTEMYLSERWLRQTRTFQSLPGYISTTFQWHFRYILPTRQNA